MAFSRGDMSAQSKISCLSTANFLAAQDGKIICMELKKIVAELMAAQGWNSPELARRVTAERKKKTNRQDIENVLSGASKSPRYLPSLAKAFGKSTEDLLAWRQGMPAFGPNDSSKAAAGVPRLTVEGSDEDASPELQMIRMRNAIKSLRFAVGAMATVMAGMRPDEAEAVADLFATKVDPDYADMGMGAEFLGSIRSAVHVARARPSARRGKGG